MRAIAFAQYGGPEVLQEVELPRPDPGPSDVVVNVEAVCIGRLLDIEARAGKLPFHRHELPHVPGAEHAGVVSAIGHDIDDLVPGTRVAVFPIISCGTCDYCRGGHGEACPKLEILGVHRPGAYAEQTRVPRQNVTPLSERLTSVEGAALALAGPLAWRQFKVADVKPGHWLLVQGAGSALGALTASLGVHLGVRVIGTSRHPEKRAALAKLGVEGVLNWTDEDFVDQVHEITGGRGVEVAIDNIGDAEMFTKSIAALDRAGTLILSGAFMGGVPPVHLQCLYTNSQRIIGLRTADLNSVHEFWDRLGADLRPVIDRTFSFSEVCAAHQYVEADRNFGRVALVR